MSLKPYIQLLRLDKPIGIYLLLWPTLAALLLANNAAPSWQLLTIFGAGTLTMRSLGCVINDLIDKKLDRQVTRTRLRPLAAQQIPLLHAYILLLLLLATAIWLALQLNHPAQQEAIVALMLALSYPWAKRITNFPQVVLAVAFSWSILVVYAASNVAQDINCWALFVANICWVIAFDTQYALQDKTDDLRVGIKSSAIAFASKVDLAIGLLQSGMLLSLTVLGLKNGFNMIYYSGLSLIAALFYYQANLIKRQHYILAFKNNNLVGLTLCLALISQNFN